MDLLYGHCRINGFQIIPRIGYYLCHLRWIGSYGFVILQTGHAMTRIGRELEACFIGRKQKLYTTFP